MQKDARAYRTTLLILLAALVIGAIVYTAQNKIPARIALPFTLAALVEAALYLVPGFASTRAIVEKFQPLALRALVIEISALLPYLIYSVGTGTFHWRSFALLAGLTTVVTAWYVVQNKKQIHTDLLFLTFVAAIVIVKVFPRIYIELAPRATASVLGQLMWFRLTILAVLSIRGMGGIGFGFIPTRKDWSIGLQQFILFMPAALICGMLMHFSPPHLAFTVWWKGLALAVGTFAGILWVVALWEEFVCRGMLQQILARRFNSTIAGLIATSVLFGLSHLPFRHFPNWKLAVMAAVAGMFYGWAYLRAGSIRAAMVTHACVVTTWKVFFA
jgi:membrane protease YdiL (CAAX protease family)